MLFTHEIAGSAPGFDTFRLRFRYCYYQYCMLSGNTGGAGGNRILRNSARKIQRGEVAIKEVLNAKKSIID